jgi:hypothetical protein
MQPRIVSRRPSAAADELAADVPPTDVVRQVVLFGAMNRDGWGVGLTILTALANLLPMLPEDETYPALFHGASRVAADRDGEEPRRERSPLGSRPDPVALKRWLRRAMIGPWSMARCDLAYQSYCSLNVAMIPKPVPPTAHASGPNVPLARLGSPFASSM